MRTCDVDLDEAADGAPHLVAHVAIGGNGRRDRHRAVARKQLGHESDATDVRVAVFLGEAETLAQVLAHFVAVEHLDVHAALQQNLLHAPRECGLSRRGKSR